MFHVKLRCLGAVFAGTTRAPRRLHRKRLPASERWRRHLAYLRRITAMERQLGHKLPLRGPPRPDLTYRNRMRTLECWRRQDAWLDFKARSDARAKAWQEKHQRARERAAACKQAWQARRLRRGAAD